MYEDLELADQGELDFFIQTKILKWTEVQRERRMKDVIFYSEFHKLREILFPINANIQQEIDRECEKEFRSFKTYLCSTILYRRLHFLIHEDD
jgi:hypothetical protein